MLAHDISSQQPAVDGWGRRATRTKFGLEGKVFEHQVVAQRRHVSERVGNDVEVVVLLDVVESNETYLRHQPCPLSHPRGDSVPGIYFFLPRSHLLTTSLSSFRTFSGV